MEDEAAKSSFVGPKGASDIDTDDDKDDEAEYEAWKARELARIKRDRNEKEKEARMADERARLQNMTEEERRQWERENRKVSFTLCH
jgi:microfibrillar-associated protein 1